MDPRLPKGDYQQMTLTSRIQKAPARSDKIPAGFYTTDEWMRREWKSESAMLRILRAGMAQGIVERASFRIHTGRGLYPTNHYREIPDDTTAPVEDEQVGNGDHRRPVAVKRKHGQGQPRRKDASTGGKARGDRRKGRGVGKAGKGRVR